MFWKFNLLTSHIDTLLDKEDVTLHELMEEDDVLQECKAQNRKLIDFLVRPEIVEEMVNLITQEPGEDVEEKVRYKYPNTACELLTSDVPQINDMLSNEDGLLKKVYAFLEGEGPLNPLLASFFSKVMGLLITRKSEFMLEFLKSREDFVANLLHHIGVSAIMDLLLRLITCIESAETRNAVLAWLDQQNLVQKLVALIDPSHSSDKHCNAAQSLCDIIRLSREQFAQLQDQSADDPLLVAVENPETVSDLLNHMFHTERNESVITNGLTVIQTLIEFKRSRILDGFYSPEGCGDQMSALEADRLAQGVSNTLLAVMPRLKDFNDLLNEPPKQNYCAMSTTAGALNPPLGNTRLQVSRLVASLLQTNTHSIFEELSNLGTMNKFLDLFFQYQWNNFLHTQIEYCINTILTGARSEDEGEKQENPLLVKLFDECNLIGRILDGWEDNELILSRPGGTRKGYMGHLTKIANLVVESLDKGNNSDSLKEIFKEYVSDEKREKWEKFVSESLTEQNKKNTVDLVGSHPLHSSSDDEDADFRDITFPQDTAMQQAFSDYQLQQMTSNFIDQFGFNEEDFAEQEERIDAPFTDKISSIDFNINANEDNPNAAMFEEACNQRIQQFDDQDSDEDIWEDKEVVLSNVSESQQSSNFSGLEASREESEQGLGTDSDSSDSEEDLQSPTKIYQTPKITSEKMDVDSNDAWPASFNDMAMDTTPPVHESPSSPWESSPTQSPKEGSNWAHFDNLAESPKKASEEQDEKWADFASFTPLEPSNLTSTDPGPRSSSPVAMDIAESSRTHAYLVQSAPADLASSIDNAKTGGGDSPTDNAQSSEDTEPQSASSGDVAAERAGATSGDKHDATSSPFTHKSEITLEISPSKVVPGSPTAASESPKEIKISSNIDNKVASETDSSEQSEGKAEEDLFNNFNYLKSSGLIKPPHHGNGPTTELPSPERDAEQAKLEGIRAQAKEALELYDNATTATSGAGGANAVNGPI